MQLTRSALRWDAKRMSRYVEFGSLGGVRRSTAERCVHGLQMSGPGSAAAAHDARSGLDPTACVRSERFGTEFFTASGEWMITRRTEVGVDAEGEAAGLEGGPPDIELRHRHAVDQYRLRGGRRDCFEGRLDRLAR